MTLQLPDSLQSLVRAVTVVVALGAATGCIHIPRAVLAELDCSPRGTGHFGGTEQCEQSPQH
jgi:hypothetical protein